MIKTLLLSFLLILNAGGEEFLNEVALYQKQSYYKDKVYAEHDWKSFYALKEANQVVNPDNYDLHLLNAAIFFSTNKVRAGKKLDALIYSGPLRDAAVVHSQQMVDKKFFDHFNNKTRKLRTPEDRMVMYGVTQAQAMGENIDFNNIQMPSKTTYIQLADKVVDAWMHSAPHRKTMLSKGYSHLGCAGVFEAKDKTGYRYIKSTQDYSLQR
ncbi:MAG TPA: CAP domain-containing protein [Chitinophagales bacterium]|nr:CAP domain-containing protein [Chitinophagales bacterium]